MQEGKRIQVWGDCSTGPGSQSGSYKPPSDHSIQDVPPHHRCPSPSHRILTTHLPMDIMAPHPIAQPFVTTGHRTLAGGFRYDTPQDVKARRAIEFRIAQRPYTVYFHGTFLQLPFVVLRKLRPRDIERYRNRRRWSKARLTVKEVEKLVKRFVRDLMSKCGGRVHVEYSIEPHADGHLHVHMVAASPHLTPERVRELWPYGVERTASWLGLDEGATRGVTYVSKHLDARDEEDTAAIWNVEGPPWRPTDIEACLPVVERYDPMRAAKIRSLEPTWRQATPRLQVAAYVDLGD